MTRPFRFLGRHRLAATGMIAFLGFFLLGASWSIGMPYDGPPDELQHVVKAYAVGGGELLVRESKPFDVPVSLVPPGAGCFRWKLQRSAACQTTPGTGGAVTDRKTSSLSGAATANPAYYLLVGPVIHAFPDFRGVIAARLITAATISTLLAWAMVVVARLSTGRWLLPGLVAACTPVVVSLSGAVNAAGLEIAAGIALWVALVALVDAQEASPAAARLAAVSASLLAVLRGFGLGWLALVVLIAGVGLSWRRLRFLARIRWVRVAVGVASTFALYSWVWSRSVSPLIPDRPTPTPLNPAVMQVFHLWSGVSTTDIYMFQLWTRLPYYLKGMVGLTSYGDVSLPEALFLFWYAAVGLLVVGALVFCGWRTRLRVGGILVIALGVLAVGDVAALRVGFYLSQGRYALAFVLGAPLLGGYALARQKILGAQQVRQLTRAYVVTLLPLQVIALWVTMLRFEYGVPTRFPIGRKNVTTGEWLPPFGPVLPFILCTAGLLVVGVLIWRLAAPPRDQVPSTPASSGDADLGSAVAASTGDPDLGSAVAASTGDPEGVPAPTTVPSAEVLPAVGRPVPVGDAAP